ncbi:MAG: GAF domain-containing protein [Myxococcota bacterium]
METKRWQLSVRELGATETIAETTVSAKNWMDALRLGRDQLGEHGDIPKGASCAIAPNGNVTVHDPLERRTYLLEPSKGLETPEAVQQDAFASSVGESSSSSGEDAQKSNEDASPDFGMSDPAPPGEDLGSSDGNNSTLSATDVSSETQKSDAALELVGTSASVHAVASDKSTPDTEHEAKQLDISTEQLDTATDKSASEDSFNHEDTLDHGGMDRDRLPKHLKLIGSRNVEPDTENPLLYRERVYALEPSKQSEAESLLRDRFQHLKSEVAERSQGKLFNLALFDHVWDVSPDRPPLVTLQWKDWLGEPVLAFPAQSTTPKDLAASRKNTLGINPEEMDTRLADAFEACQDLLFLDTPIEGFQFVQRLLGELTPCEAFCASLYDIDLDAFRVVVVTGHAAEQRQATTVPAVRGILGEVTRSQESIVRVDDCSKNSMFDPEIDGLADLEIQGLIYGPLVRHGQPLGMLQLLNRTSESKRFTEEDEEIVAYVARQLSRFLLDLRMRRSD